MMCRRLCKDRLLMRLPLLLHVEGMVGTTETQKVVAQINVDYWQLMRAFRQLFSYYYVCDTSSTLDLWCIVMFRAHPLLGTSFWFPLQTIRQAA
jgi:predicted NodU family carbamoyl transferase